MAPTTSKNASSSAKRVSPTQDRAKRERSDDEETTRRVSQRANEEKAEDTAAGAKDNMDELVLNGLLTNNEDVLKETLMKINTLLYDKKEDTVFTDAQNDFFHLGGHVAAVRVMEKNLGCVKIQEWGACVLSNACIDNDRINKTIVRVGGIPAILEAMKEHSKNEMFIFFAIRAIHNLTIVEPNAEIFVTKTDGVSLVLKCMKTFADDDKIVFEACDLFYNLCKHDQLRGKLDDVNVGTPLMAAYNNNKDNEEIRKTAGEAMKLLLE